MTTKTNSTDGREAHIVDEPLPYPVDSLVPYGFSSAAVRQHCAYQKRCTDQLNALVQQQRTLLSLPDGPQELLTLLRLAPASSPIAQLAAELVNHRYYWSSLRPATTSVVRDKYLRATLTKPVHSEAPPAPRRVEVQQDSAFSAAVAAKYGSMMALRQQLVSLSRSLHGGGWVWLVWDRQDSCLQLLLQTGACCPLTVSCAALTQAMPAEAPPAPTQAMKSEKDSSARTSATPARSELPNRPPSSPRRTFGRLTLAQVVSVAPSVTRVLSRGVSELSSALGARVTNATRQMTKKRTENDTQSVPSRPSEARGASPKKLAPSTAKPPSASTLSDPSTRTATSAGESTQAARAATSVPSTPRYSPLFACDLWEHAYLRDFGFHRETYVGCFWSALDWRVVESRFDAAVRATGSTTRAESKL